MPQNVSLSSSSCSVDNCNNLSMVGVACDLVDAKDLVQPWPTDPENRHRRACAPAHLPHRRGVGGDLVARRHRLLTGSTNSTVRVWDATSGRPVGYTIVTLPGREIAVFDAITDQLVGASAGA